MMSALLLCSHLGLPSAGIAMKSAACRPALLFGQGELSHAAPSPQSHASPVAHKVLCWFGGTQTVHTAC